jgi:predicted transcriptional regulator
MARQSIHHDEVTTMQSAKQEALEAIERLPDDVDTEEMIYRLYVLENIRRGQQDAAEGKTQPAEEVLKDIQAW